MTSQKKASGSLPDYSGYRGVYIEDVDGYLYTEDEWDGSKTPNGVAVLTDNCQFVIALHNAYSSSCRYGGYGTEVSGITTTTSSSTAATDYNGEANTTTIINALNGTNDGYADGAPAAEYCRAFTFPNGATGYLGAAGEWQAALDNKAAITSALSKCGGTAMSNYYWTSTQYSSASSWYVRWGNERLYDDTKYYANYVRAFTTLKSDDQESGGGKTVNKITAVISESRGETIVDLSTQYPVASEVGGYLVTSMKSGFFSIFKDSCSRQASSIGEFQDIYLETTEDDTYIYELVIE